MFSSKSLDNKHGPPTRKTILSRFEKFCDSQKGKEFLWYSISFTTLIGAIMPISLIAMYFTPYFYQFTFISMLLFFGNVITVIGKASIKGVISFYMFTVFVNVMTPAICHLLL